MKTIATIIIVILTQTFVFGQNSNGKHAKPCVLEYSENKWIINHNDTMPHICNEFVISNLPPMTQEITPINLDIIYKGYYSLKKDRSLKISREYHVVIKDLVTGEFYNLNSSESYPFSLTKASQKTRFVMEIRKEKVKGKGHENENSEEVVTASR